VSVVRIGGDETPWSTDPDVVAPEPERRSETATGSPLVLVTWRDAWFDFEESDAEDARSDYLVTTVGFLVRRGPRFVSIAQEILPDGDGFRAITHIPVAVVETLATLEVLEGDEERDQAVP
jgi:hypothetical protein